MTAEQMREAAAVIAENTSTHGAYIAAAIRAIPIPDKIAQVTVRPLMWEATEYKMPAQNGHHATGCGIRYAITSGRDNLKCILSSGLGIYIGPFHLDSVEEAKAAAQADYTARILSAIEVTP